MKILFTTFLLFSLSFGQVLAQEKILFSNVYSANKEYIKETLSTNENQTLFTGSPDFLNYLKTKEIANPKIEKSESTMKMAYRIGTLKDSSYPIEVEYIETGTKDEYDALKNGDKVTGTYSTDGKINFTDISSKSMNADYKNEFLKFFEYGISSELFKGKMMSIGDTLLSYAPLSIPFAGIQVTLIVSTSYKLKAIEKDLAYFDIIQEYKIGAEMKEISFIANGNGTGSCVYDIKNQHIISSKSETAIQLKKELEKNIQMEINIISKSISSAKISKL